MPSKPLAYELDLQPVTGDSDQLLPGLVCVRQKLPFSLDHINVWLLFDDANFCIVDTGLNSKPARQLWDDVLDKYVPTQTADKIVVTHLHPDHAGLAGWLNRKLDCPLWITSSEYFLCRVLCDDSTRSVPQVAVDFYRTAGMSESDLQHYTNAYGQFGRAVSELPQTYTRLQHNDTVRIGPYQWRVIIGNGHSPEHACLYSEEINTLISGDQLLPTISSIVAVWPTEPEANPLQDWLESCQRLQTEVPEDVLVLPSHGRPFRGAHDRLQELIDHHQEKLALLHEFCRQPRRVIDLFSILFRSTINKSNMTMAVGETIAHLNYLRFQGRLEKTRGSDGLDWYQAI